MWFSKPKEPNPPWIPKFKAGDKVYAQIKGTSRTFYSGDEFEKGTVGTTYVDDYYLNGGSYVVELENGKTIGLLECMLKPR